MWLAVLQVQITFSKFVASIFVPNFHIFFCKISQGLLFSNAHRNVCHFVVDECREGTNYKPPTVGRPKNKSQEKLGGNLL